MSDTQPLVEKYRPQNWSDIQGNNQSLKQLRSWAQNWDRSEPQLLDGPPGVGKTSTAQVMANEMDWPIEEVNASDARTSDDVAALAERIKVTPIDAPYQLILVDEVDSIPGRTNIKPLLDVLKDPPNPVLLVCNEKWEVRDSLVSACEVHDFSLQQRSRMAKLKEIAAAEELDVGAATLGNLAQRENLRDAIQDLQSVAAGHDPEDGREYGSSPFETLDSIRKGHGIDGMTDQTPPELQRWLVTGLEDRYRGVEAQVVWDLIARAEKWNARATPNNDFRYWYYAGVLQRQIAESRLTDAYDGYVRYGSPDWVAPPNSQGDSTEAALYQALSGESGRPGLTCNFAEFRSVYLPVLRERPAEERHQMAVEHGLSDKAMKALDLDPDHHEDWATEEGARVEENSVFEW